MKKVFALFCACLLLAGGPAAAYSEEEETYNGVANYKLYGNTIEFRFTGEERGTILTLQAGAELRKRLRGCRQTAQEAVPYTPDDMPGIYKSAAVFQILKKLESEGKAHVFFTDCAPGNNSTEGYLCLEVKNLGLRNCTYAEGYIEWQ